MAFFKKTEISVDCTKGDLPAMKAFLLGKRGFLLGLLENQNLLEHDEFTDLLWAVFHLTEELDARQRLEGLPQSDLDHLAGDTRRVFFSLTREWLRYMEHLRNDYPVSLFFGGTNESDESRGAGGSDVKSSGEIFC